MLAKPGSREIDKAYHEPGGSFSPSVSSFGVSIWLVDEHGILKMTSDSIPLSEIQQQFSWRLERDIPGILTNTMQYEAYWASSGPRAWILNLKSLTDVKTKPIVVIRSIGPAGGPIFSISWNGKYLLINKRWKITIQPNSAKINLGREQSKDWTTESSNIDQINDGEGWCYAKIELTDLNDFSLLIQDTTASEPILGPKVTNTRTALELDLPDKRFAASLDAQVAHIMMMSGRHRNTPGRNNQLPPCMATRWCIRSGRARSIWTIAGREGISDLLC